MTRQQAQDAQMLERELRDIAGHEKAQYKRQTQLQAARLLRELLDADEDEPHTGPTDDSA